MKTWGRQPIPTKSRTVTPSVSEQAKALLEALGLHEEGALRRRLARQPDGTPCVPTGDGAELASVVATNGQAIQAHVEREVTAAILDHASPEKLGAALAATLKVTQNQVKGAKARATAVASDGTEARPARTLIDVARGFLTGDGGLGGKAKGVIAELDERQAQQAATWRLIVLNEEEDLLGRVQTGLDRVVRRRGELRQLAGGAAAAARAEADEVTARLGLLGDGLPEGFFARMVEVLAAEEEEQARHLGLGAVAEVVAAEEERSPDAAARIMAGLRDQSEREVVIKEDYAQVVGRVRSAAGLTPGRGVQLLVAHLTEVGLAEAPHQPLEVGGTRASYQVLGPGTRPLLAMEKGTLGIARMRGGRRDRLGLLHIQGDRRLEDLEIMASARAALLVAERAARHRLLPTEAAEEMSPLGDELLRYAAQAEEALNSGDDLMGTPGTDPTAD